MTYWKPNTHKHSQRLLEQAIFGIDWERTVDEVFKRLYWKHTVDEVFKQLAGEIDEHNSSRLFNGNEVFRHLPLRVFSRTKM
jgi:hypothetical protein